MVKQNPMVTSFISLATSELYRVPIMGREGYRITRGEYRDLAPVIKFWQGGKFIAQEYVYFLDDLGEREIYLRDMADRVSKITGVNLDDFRRADK